MTDSPGAGYWNNLPDLDEQLHLLSNQRRRYVIRHVDAVGETTLDETADAVTAAIHSCKPFAITSKQRKPIYIGLYQEHLPTLAEADIVNYDKDRKTITPGPRFDELAAMLAVLEDCAAGSGDEADRTAGIMNVARTVMPSRVDAVLDRWGRLP